MYNNLVFMDSESSWLRIKDTIYIYKMKRGYNND